MSRLKASHVTHAPLSLCFLSGTPSKGIRSCSRSTTRGTLACTHAHLRTSTHTRRHAHTRANKRKCHAHAQTSAPKRIHTKTHIHTGAQTRAQIGYQFPRNVHVGAEPMTDEEKCQVEKRRITAHRSVVVKSYIKQPPHSISLSHRSLPLTPCRTSSAFPEFLAAQLHPGGFASVLCQLP